MIRAELSYTKAHFRKLLSLNKKNTFRKIYCAACFALGLIFMFLFIRIDSSEIAYFTLGLILLICGGITLRWTVMMLPANQLKNFSSYIPMVHGASFSTKTKYSAIQKALSIQEDQSTLMRLLIPLASRTISLCLNYAAIPLWLCSFRMTSRKEAPIS